MHLHLPQLPQADAATGKQAAHTSWPAQAVTPHHEANKHRPVLIILVLYNTSGT
jgi:hypothetical protein